MQVELCMQNGEKNTFSQAITDGFDAKPKKVYILCGKLREGGFKILEDCLCDYSNKLFFAIGVDKKNITKIMLEDILSYTNDVYYYSNNNIIEFDSNVIIFEYTDKALLYITSSNLSESGICDNIAIYTKAIYDLKDKKEKEEYKKQLKEILKNIEKEIFTKLEKEEIDELVKRKEIFTTNQYTHSNIKSISDLLGKMDTKKGTVKTTSLNEEKKSKNKIDLKEEEIEIDIDLSSSCDDDYEDEIIEIEEKNNDFVIEKKSKNDLKDAKDVENVEGNEDFDLENEFKELKEIEDEIEEEFENEIVDIENMLFSKSNIKLNIPVKETETENTKKIEEDSVKTKKVNLADVANFILELPSKSNKKNELNEIKIPNYIQKMIPEFFEILEKGKNEEINGVTYKTRNISVKAVDVKNNLKYNDRDAKIMQKANQTYITINTNTINSINYEEGDIARIIKLSSTDYHIEIISKEIQEYKLWSKLCNQTFKSSKRKYGMM